MGNDISVTVLLEKHGSIGVEIIIIVSNACRIQIFLTRVHTRAINPQLKPGDFDSTVEEILYSKVEASAKITIAKTPMNNLSFHDAPSFLRV